MAESTRKRSRKAGLPPGTLVHIGERKTDTARREFLAALAIDPSHEGAIEQLRAMELHLVRRNRPRIATPSPQPTIAKAAKKPAPVNKKPTVQAKAVEVAKVNDQAPAQVTSKSLQQAMGLAEKGAFLESIPHFREHLTAHPQDAKAKRLLATSHREVGITLYNDGKLRESVNHLEASANQAEGSDHVVDMALADAKGRLAQAAYENGIKAFRQKGGINDERRAVQRLGRTKKRALEGMFVARGTSR